jgi:transcriptional regulator with XRE-family HTH domain
VTVREEDGPERGAAERLDASQLGQVVRAHRGARSMRQAAAEAGVSLSTMSRVESGSLPDLASFTALCAWAGVSPGRFFTPIAERQDTHVEVAIAHLSADPRLSPEHASSIAAVVRQMYDAREAGAEPAAPLAACHLRAAPTLRPGVPERLGGIIVDLHKALERRVKEDSRT